MAGKVTSLLGWFVRWFCWGGEKRSSSKNPFKTELVLFEVFEEGYMKGKMHLIRCLDQK